MNITVIGLGKLGLPLAVYLGAQKHNVIGYDSSAERRDAVRLWIDGGPCPVNEPGMNEHLHACLCVGGLTVSDEPVASDVNMIIVPTPSTRSGAFDNTFVLKVIDDLAPTLRKKCPGVAVVLVSTTSPRSCAEQIVPHLERAVGGTNGIDFDFYYNPEFIALGSVINDLAHPDILLCGAGPAMVKTPAVAHDLLLGLYGWELRRRDGWPTEVCVMSYTEAELAKLALNCAVTQKICFANAIGSIADRLGCDPRRVLNAVGGDSRIGKAYLRFGTPFGGPCFPRDGMAMLAAIPTGATASSSSAADFLVSTSSFRRHQLNDQLSCIRRYLAARSKVAILGVAYKPRTDFCEESASIHLENGLRQNGHDVRSWDPLAAPGDPYEVAAKCDALCVMHPGLGLDWERLARGLAHGALVWAPWGEPTHDEVSGAAVFYSTGYVP